MYQGKEGDTRDLFLHPIVENDGAMGTHITAPAERFVLVISLFSNRFVRVISLFSNRSMGTHITAPADRWAQWARTLLRPLSDLYLF